MHKRIPKQTIKNRTTLNASTDKRKDKNKKSLELRDNRPEIATKMALQTNPLQLKKYSWSGLSWYDLLGAPPPKTLKIKDGEFIGQEYDDSDDTYSVIEHPLSHNQSDLKLTSRERMLDAEESTHGRFKPEDTVYGKGRPNDILYEDGIVQGTQGKTSLKLGWNSAAHVVLRGGVYRLKKLVTGRTNNLGERKLKTHMEQLGGECAVGTVTTTKPMEVSFDREAGQIKPKLDEVITFGISTCSFIVLFDDNMTELIIMHIDNDAPIPISSFSCDVRLNNRFCSMIDEDREKQKMVQLDSLVGIDTVEELRRPYDQQTHHGMHPYTHNAMGIALHEEPLIIGEQGDSDAAIQHLMAIEFASLNREVEAKDDKCNFAELHSKLNKALEMMHIEVETISTILRRLYIKTTKKLGTSISEQVVRGAICAYENPEHIEVEHIKTQVRDNVDTKIKRPLKKQN